MQKIVVNGNSYSNIDEMPSEIRKLYQDTIDILADKDNNGIPDILEDRIDAHININDKPVQIDKTTIININGKEYTDISELPPDAQSRYKLAMKKLDQVLCDKNETSGMIEKYQPATSTMSTTSFEESDFIKQSPLIVSPMDNDEKHSYRGLILNGILIMIIIVALLVKIIL